MSADAVGHVTPATMPWTRVKVRVTTPLCAALTLFFLVRDSSVAIVLRIRYSQVLVDALGHVFL